MGEDFRLKWNDHHSVFFSTAESLCHGDHLTDVTLSAGDKEFSAHKLVLSICSNYFSQLFAPRPESQKLHRRRPADGAAIVYLKDVDSKHMELLLNYMYRGEINVEESELMGLLATAKSLQIKGLTEADDDDTKGNYHSESQAVAGTSRGASSSSMAKKRPAPRPTNSSNAPSTSSSSSSAAKKIKEETLEPHAGAPVPVVGTDDYNEPDEATNDEYLEGDDDPSAMLESQDDYNLDTSQGESMAYEGDPNNPGSIKMRDGRYCCPYCTITKGSVMAIRRHLVIHTGEKPYNCPYCPAKFNQKFNCNKHVRKFHDRFHFEATPRKRDDDY